MITTNDVNSSRLKLCTYPMAFITPIAGALLFMISIIRLILSINTRNEIFLTDIYSFTVPVLVGVVLVASGIFLLIGVMQEKGTWIFLYLAASTPGLVYLTCEVVTLDFLCELKIAILASLVAMLCDQICVLGYFLIVVKKKRTESMEDLMMYEYGYLNYTMSNSSESISSV